MNLEEPLWVWIVTVLAFFTVYTAEFIYAKRHPHVVKFREAAQFISLQQSYLELLYGELKVETQE
jgi:hypothetical protein